MISFDVSSLYTNVPVKEAIDKAAERLYAGDLQQPPVDKEKFILLAELSALDVIMSIHDGYYKQTDGLAMGAPPAPYLANIWLSQYDSTIMDNAKIGERYMDDILRSIASNKVTTKLEKINNLHPNLKFTIETEQDGRHPFLDLCLIHTDSQLKSTWYTKPNDTGLIMNYHAAAPRKYKHQLCRDSYIESTERVAIGNCLMKA